MLISDLQDEAKVLTRWERHRFFGLVAGVILISIFMVSVALSLYQSSGAAQLDLSRPGYTAVRKEAAKGESSVSYPSNGPLDEESLADFRRLYNDRIQRVTSTRSFEASAMSDDSLQMYDKPEPTTEEVIQ